MPISETIYNTLYNSLDGTGIGRIPTVERLRQLWMRRIAKGRVVTADYGAKLEIDEYDNLHMIRNKGVYETETKEFIDERLSREQGIAVDLGANIGYFTILMAKLANKVYAFEPSDTTRAILERNVIMNHCKNVLVSRKAISSSKGIAELYGTKALSGANSLISNGSKSMQRVETDTLDNLIKDHNISLIKMDIEGNELEAIKGAKDTLSRCRNLVVEYNPTILKQTKTGSQLMDIITGSGFTIENMADIKSNGGNILASRESR